MLCYFSLAGTIVTAETCTLVFLSLSCAPPPPHHHPPTPIAPPPPGRPRAVNQPCPAVPALASGALGPARSLTLVRSAAVRRRSACCLSGKKREKKTCLAARPPPHTPLRHHRCHRPTRGGVCTASAAPMLITACNFFVPPRSGRGRTSRSRPWWASTPS